MRKVFEVRYALVPPVEIALCGCGEQDYLPEIIAHTHWELDGIDGYRVACPTCGDMTAEYKTRIDAIKDWNAWKGGDAE